MGGVDAIHNGPPNNNRSAKNPQEILDLLYSMNSNLIVMYHQILRSNAPDKATLIYHAISYMQSKAKGDPITAKSIEYMKNEKNLEDIKMEYWRGAGQNPVEPVWDFVNKVWIMLYGKEYFIKKYGSVGNYEKYVEALRSKGVIIMNSTITYVQEEVTTALQAEKPQENTA